VLTYGDGTLKPAQHNIIDKKHEQFVFIIPPQPPGTLQGFVDCVFDGEPWRLKRRFIKVT